MLYESRWKIKYFTIIFQKLAYSSPPRSYKYLFFIWTGVAEFSWIAIQKKVAFLIAKRYTILFISKNVSSVTQIYHLYCCLLLLLSFIPPGKVSPRQSGWTTEALQRSIFSVTHVVLLALETGVPLLKLTGDSAMLLRSSLFLAQHMLFPYRR